MGKGFYAKHSIQTGPMQGSVKDASFIEEPKFEKHEDQAPDAVFSGKGKRKNEAKGILQILTMIIEDPRDELRNGQKAEEEAIADYNEQKAAANKMETELTEQHETLKEAIASLKDSK